MKNNEIGKIQISTSKHPKTKFNLSHDVNTTCSWGDTQPLLCRLMSPGTKNVLQVDSLVRLAPMVAPTFGRIKYKTWHQFVNMNDIWHGFKNFIAQSPRFSNTGTFTPLQVPQVPVCLLTALCLSGAKCGLYANAENPDLSPGSGFTDQWVSGRVNDLSSTVPSCFDKFFNVSIFAGSPLSVPPFGGYSGPTLNLGRLFAYNVSLSSTILNKYGINFDGTNPPNTNPWVIPSANTSQASFMELTNVNYPDLTTDNVGIENSDISLTVTIVDASDTYKYLLCFRLSSFGKRLRKVLLGLGYQLDIYNCDMVSILPLLAYFKAYWDLFGLTKFKAWEETCGFFLDQFLCNNIGANGSGFFNNIVNYGTLSNNPTGTYYFVNLIYEIGNAFVTDLPDFVGAHTTDLSSGPRIAGLDFIDTTSIGTNSPRIVSSSGSSASAAVSSGLNKTYPVAGNITSTGELSAFSSGNTLVGFLSGLTIESLQRLYRWTNKHSVVGMEIANILKAQGYGYFVYSCKSNFIGYEETYVTISDVVSSADTLDSNTDEGALLGQYGGRGLEYNESKSFEFETDEFGYWVTLAAIVPQSGYNQGIDPSLYCLDKFDFYNPEFDGLGMEVTKLPVVCGDAPLHIGSTAYTSDGFGFIPRYSGLKIAQNVNNGDFSLPSRSKNYSPFQLDKYIPMNRPWVGPKNTLGTNTDITQIREVFTRQELPTAGQIWRYVSRFPWLGKFDRIFAADNSRDYLDWLFFMNAQLTDPNSFELLVNFVDNFNIHNVLNLQSYARMLPIEESFGTESHNGGFDAAMDKT